MIVSIQPICTYMLDFIAHVPAMSALLRNTGRTFIHIEWLRFSTSLIWQQEALGSLTDLFLSTLHFAFKNFGCVEVLVSSGRNTDNTCKRWWWCDDGHWITRHLQSARLAHSCISGSARSTSAITRLCLCTSQSACPQRSSRAGNLGALYLVHRYIKMMNLGLF